MEEIDNVRYMPMKNYEDGNGGQDGGNYDENGWGDLSSAQFNSPESSDSAEVGQETEATALGEKSEEEKGYERLKESKDDAIQKIGHTIEQNCRDDRDYVSSKRILFDVERMHDIVDGDWAMSKIEDKYGSELKNLGISIGELFDVVSSYTPTHELAFAHKNYTYAQEHYVMFSSVTPYEYFCGELPGIMKRNFSDIVPDDEKEQYIDIVHKISGSEKIADEERMLTESEKKLLSKRYAEALDCCYGIKDENPVEWAESVRADWGVPVLITFDTLVDSMLARLSISNQEEFAEIIEMAKASQGSQE
jgi:hypothetical protein